MLPEFSEKERAVHYPADRRLVFRLRPKVALLIALVIVVVVGVAWAQYLIWGLPRTPEQLLAPLGADEPRGFPFWVCWTHWVNAFFLILLMRSGLSILFDHPRLYWNDGCTPGSEWLRMTPTVVPKDKVWTAKDDARYLSPLVGLPGYRHTVGLARGWHFISVPFFLLNGVLFVTLLLLTDQWKRLVPTSWQLLRDAWSVFVHYATLHMPPEPNGYYRFNPLQQLSYFAVVFILPPLAILSGVAMSPAFENRFHWVPKIFGNRQGARSAHFLVMLSYLAFLVAHVTMVAATGLARNMNHITRGVDVDDPRGLWIGLALLGGIAASAVLAHWISWHRPRWLQRTQARLNGTLWGLSLNRLSPQRFFEKKDISPFFWPNGKLPDSENWRRLAANAFADYRLTIGGLVEKPTELSLEGLKALGFEQNITMHHCIQGWSGIAEWGGVPLKAIVELVKPHPGATTVVFYSFGEGLYGGVYYDTHTLDNCLKPSSILAWEMNYQPLPELYGAPLRLRIENQLGYKMVKWIERIEFVDSHTKVGKGYGGKNEDDEYFDLLANT